MKLPNDVKFILEKLNNFGLEAYVVGGCVRDTLLGKEPKDWDICTNAKPEKVMEVFKDFEIIPTGLQHGTVTVMLNHIGYEITTYRIDGDYSDGRHPDSVSFTSDLAEDLSRRDFTINALAYNEVEGIVDIFGGIEDLKNKKIKCVGTPIDRFNEDALRILRALRFSSVLGFKIEENTKQAIFEIYKNLDKIAKERINVEFSKMLQGINNVKILREYIEVYGYIIPELLKMKGFEQVNPYHKYDVLEHTLKVIENLDRDNLPLLLAGLFHDIAKPITFFKDEAGVGHFNGHPSKSAEMSEIILKNLKYSNDIIDRTLWLIKYHDLMMTPDNKFIRKILRKSAGFDENSKTMFELLLKLRRADILGQSEYKRTERLEVVDLTEKLLRDFVPEDDCFTVKQLNINGNDLIAMGYEAGKFMGVILNELLNKVINEELQNDKESLKLYVLEKYPKNRKI